MTPSTLVLAFLMLINPYPSTPESVLTVATPPVQMTIEECLTQATEINKDKDSPFLMMCSPIIPSNGA